MWLAAVEKYGRQVDAHILAEYWTSYIIPNWAEYGMGKANLRVVLHPVGFLRRQQWVRVTALPSPGVAVRGAASREVPFNDLWRNRVELVFTVNADEATTSRVEILFDFAMPGRATQGAVKAILFRK